MKLVNATAAAVTCPVSLAGVKAVRRGTLTVLRADELEAVNAFDAPERVAPRETVVTPEGTTFSVALPANSFAVVRVGVAR